MDKLEKLKQLMSIVNESITKDEFSSAFKSLIDFVKKVEKDLTSKIDSKTQEAENELREINELYQETIKKVEEENKSSLSNVRKWALEEVGKLFIKSKLNEKLGDLDSALERANNLTLPDVNQVALEASKMAQDELLAAIPKQIVLGEELPSLGKPIKDALELLQDDERLDKSAIKGLQEELDRIIAMIGKNGSFGGGVGLPRTTDVDSEVPTGTIDGSNTDFTINYVPVNGSIKVFRGGARQKITEDYTVSGQTITFLIAPQVNEILIVDYKR
jgi:Asp-tRNA(Asn)/Glu-tRNA(Gln) amidotransferase C subunit